MANDSPVIKVLETTTDRSPFGFSFHEFPGNTSKTGLLSVQRKKGKLWKLSRLELYAVIVKQFAVRTLHAILLI